jgi:hypothetical protein
LRCNSTPTGGSRSPAAAPARTCPHASRTGISPTRPAKRSKKYGRSGDLLDERVREFVEQRLDAIRSDRTAHQLRLERLLPTLIDEFEDIRHPDVIRGCADAILADYDQAPVRSFALILAERRARDCLREDECAVLAGSGR